MSTGGERPARRASWTLLLVGGGLLAAAGWWGWEHWEAPTAELAATPAPRPLTDVEVRNLDIEFYQVRVRRDSLSAADFARLAGLYLQRARETGDYEDFRRAERSARHSLELRRDRNASGWLNLASSLLAQHFFVDALEVARQLTLLEPENGHYRALRGEIELELGLYDEAAATFGRLGGERRNLAVLPRLARWAEIEGRNVDARRLLEAALEEVRRRPDLAAEQVAWFHLRLGDLHLRNGRLETAGSALRAGLAVAPADPRLLSAMARLEAARGDWEEALAYARRAAGIVPDIATVALIGDAWAALGDFARAEAAYQEVERMAAANPEPYNRAWTLFRVDHGRALPETVALLREELKSRHDVYGHDQLAWALYRSGDYAGAREAMAGALRMNTQDAVLFFHAGMIERALGAREAASAHLERARALNPYLHATAPVRRLPVGDAG